MESCPIISSLVYNSLIKTAWLGRRRGTASFWHRVWRKSNSLFSGPVRSIIHGHSVILNFGNTYPIIARTHSSFNNPIIELVYQAYKLKGQPIAIVDVGAAIGDTILLLQANCPNMIKCFYCVDGDPEFNVYLQNNVGHLNGGNIISAMLSSSQETVNELLRTHSSTASAQGKGEISATTLDALILSSDPIEVDLIKIDVDGFDGKVLCGARQTLSRYRPAVIFEWHPIICQQTSNNWLDHFNALTECGYTKFIWFTKFGEFSHFMGTYDVQSIDALARFCLESVTRPDWHYDVIALHESSLLADTALAELIYASSCPSRY